MNTNPVNAQNRAFFADLHDAVDRLERDHPSSPVVLTGTGTRFSAGSGEPVAARTCLLGETFTPVEAHRLGMFHELAADDELVARAVAVAGMTPPDCLDQYAFTKRACQAAALRDIAALAEPLDEGLPDGMTSDDARHAHRRYWEQLKGRPATW